MNTNASYDLIVLGGGPAGYSAAIRGAQMGASVLLVEKAAFGGVCLQCGCIPTKFIWEALRLEDNAKKFTEYSFATEAKTCDFRLVQQRKARTIDLLTKSLKNLIASHGVTMAEGSAAFAGPNDIEITAKDGTTSRVTGKHFVIAAGSSPRSIPGFAIDHAAVVDSTDVLNFESVPKSMLIIGGGAIGVEFAGMLNGFGCEVTLAEKEPQLLPGEDADLAEEVKRSLARQGINVLTGVQSLDDLKAGKDKILVATGRQPNVSGLNLEKAGVSYTPRGIQVNERQQTSAAHIFAAGDVAGRSYLAYTAQGEGIAAAENALGKKTTFEYAAIPRVVFGKPTAASAGAKQKDLADGSFNTGLFPMSANGRAFIAGERTGWVKIFSDKTSSVVLGGQIAGPHAEDLITIVATAVKHKLKIHDLSRDLFFHPSIAETVYGACEDAETMCVELPKKK